MIKRERAIKILNQQKRFEDKETFFYNSCHSMAPTAGARFCGFPQGSNRARRNSILQLETCRGDSSLPPKPFSHLKNQRETHYMAALSGMMNRASFSLKGALITGLLSNCYIASGLLRFILFTISNRALENTLESHSDDESLMIACKNCYVASASFKHCKPSSDSPETCWLPSNVLC